MRLAERLRRAVLRWNRMGVALALALPFIVSAALGFVWLYERGWLLWFALASVTLYAVMRLATYLSRKRALQGERPARELQPPAPNPDWSEAETAAYDRARARIDERLKDPVPWPDLPAEALAVVEAVAADMSDGKRSALDFTLPEALLLIDRVALQYREFLLANVPWSDRLSVCTMHWLWRNQDTALTAWETGFLAWRGIRLVMNPAVGLLREAERVLASGLQDRLTDRFRRDAQAILLEEAAQAAVDLYSGRLKASDADLARASLNAEARDRLMAAEEGPLRIVVVGQRGAGKSTLIDALLDEDAALGGEATARTEAHDWAFDGAVLRLIDTPGLDGTERATKATATLMKEADMVLWVHRANRPGRAPDAALAEAFKAILPPEHRAPPLIHVATGADLLLPGWPRPEHALTPDERARLDAGMRTIGAVHDDAAVIPVRAQPPDWNLAALTAAIATALPNARRTRRSRMQGEAAQSTGLGDNLRRAGRGLRSTVRTVWGRMRR